MRKNQKTVDLTNWNTWRSSSIIFAQILRILSRDPYSKGVKRLIHRLNEINDLKLEEKDFYLNKRSLKNHFFRMQFSFLLKNEKPYIKGEEVNWEKPITSIFK